MGLVLSYFFAGLYLCLMIFMLQLFYRPGADKRLVNNTTLEKVGSLYEDLRIDPSSLLYPTIFIMKRVAFAYMAMMVQETLSCLFCFYLSTVFSMMYLGAVKPLAHSKMLKLELFNEMTILTFIVAISGYVGTVTDFEDKKDVGWLCCLIIAIYLAVHITNTFTEMIVGVKNDCKRKCCKK